jgi:hypothetical protein
MPINETALDPVIEETSSSSRTRTHVVGRLAAVIGLLVLVLEASAGQDVKKAKGQELAIAGAMLSDADKSELVDVLRMQFELGDQAYPGFGRTRIPIILFNESFEFLVGDASLDAPWAAVKGDSFNGKPYYRRAASSPQAFATGVGDGWAGSLSTLDWMNRRGPMKITREIHVMAIIHEMFHAYQAIRSHERFKRALKVYALEAQYPFKEPDFAATWDQEGSLLAAALKAKDGSASRVVIRDFLRVRDARRKRAALSPELIAFEHELEWLEGLAKYVEIRLGELRAGERAYSGYLPGLPYFQGDLVRLERQMGRQDGDLRFYLSGMAQGRLLDGVSQSWKEQIMGNGVCLEELLRVAVGVDKD